jgi:hypothetical protein
MTNERVRILEREIYEKTREIEGLKLENSRYTQRGSETGYWDGFTKRETKNKQEEYRQE